ncbi:MAG: XdhC family protein [Chloroflexi bacterium]|nr:XdhC family protein [Chloroflexota bacterium]
MREVITEILNWRNQGKAVALATIVKMEGSPLRPLGSKMAVTSDHQIAGSITGGCIEGFVYEEAQGVIRSGQPKLLHVGVAKDQSPWDIGLSCGSSLDVLIESVNSPLWEETFPVLPELLGRNPSSAIATVISGEMMGQKLILLPGGKTLGKLGSEKFTREIVLCMKDQLQLQAAGATLVVRENESLEVFIDVFVPPSRLIIVGAVHIAIQLVTLAKSLGYYVIVIDPRSAFATRERFPDADELINEWPSTAIEKLIPDEGTSIAVLSHDDKLDNPALKVALASQARYVGVLGTRRNVAKRLNELRDLGVSEKDLKRLVAPIGLEIGAVQPDEIALAVLSEIVAAKHGRPLNLDIQHKSIVPLK